MPERKFTVEYLGDLSEKEIAAITKKATVEIKEVQVVEKPVVRKERDSTNVFTQRRKWPKACLRCGGDGGVGDAEDEVDEDMIDESLCPSCLGQGKCPRCASKLPDDWKEKVNGLYLSIENGSEPPPPVECSSCHWEDGDPPVMNIQEG